jgi:hypothetical protein
MIMVISPTLVLCTVSAALEAMHPAYWLVWPVMLQENAEQRIWFEEHLPFPQSQKKYFIPLSENMIYPQSVGFCCNPCRMSTQMENLLLKSATADNVLLSAIDVCITSRPEVSQTYLQSLKQLQRQCCSWCIH